MREHKIHFTPEALASATPEQEDACIRLASVAELVEVTAALYGLPDGYLSFRQKYNSETRSIYGGISPEGDVST